MASSRVTWLHAPAGAGKTTLLASYLAARQASVIWYDVDAGDVDPNVAYEYLRIAADRLGGAPLSLPVLRPGPPEACQLFARRFFEALCARLPSGTCIVFDNYQDAAASAAWNETFRAFCSVLPSGIRIMVAGRLAPPAALIRLTASDEVRILDWDQLRLNQSEVITIARREGGAVRVSEAAHLLALTEGWAVAVALLARGQVHTVRRADRSRRKQTLADRLEVVFSFFAEEILHKLDEPTREFLFRLSLLPEFDVATATEITGRGDAAAVLAQLHRDQLLLERPGDTSFRLHDLFRTFLVQRGPGALGRDEWTSLSVRAASLLADHGRFQVASEMLAGVREWSRLGDLIERQAPLLAQQGCLATLASALATMPKEQLDRRPWLLYWHGLTMVGRPGAEAGVIAEVAFEGFRQANDIAGACLSWVLAVQAAVMGGEDYHRLDRWLDAFDRVELHPPSPDIAIQMAHARVVAAFYRMSSSSRSLEIAAWALDIVRRHGSTEDQVIVGGVAAVLNNLGGNWTEAQAIRRSYQFGARRAKLDPAIRLNYLQFEALLDFQLADFDRFSKVVSEGLVLARENGMNAQMASFSGMAAFQAMLEGKLEKADEAVEATMSGPLGDSCMAQGTGSFLQGWLAFERGDLPKAIEWNERSIQIALRMGFALGLSQSTIAAVAFRATQGDGEALAAAMERMASTLVTNTDGYLGFTAGAVRAYADLCIGEHGVDTLREVFADASKRPFVVPAFMSPRVVRRLVIAALENEIEPEFAMRLLHAYNLRPGPDTAAICTWPYQVKIRLLGPLAVEVGGRVLKFGRKLPQVPIMLLRLLATTDEPLHTRRLASALWPGYGGGAPRGLLDTAVYRLRKLLGSDETVDAQGGHLSLPDAICWTDTRALALCCQQIANLKRSNDSALIVAQAARYQRSLMQLYHGQAGAEDEPFLLLRARDRIHRRFLRAVEDLHAIWSQAGDRARAVEVMQLAADRDRKASFRSAGRPGEMKESESVRHP